MWDNLLLAYRKAAKGIRLKQHAFILAAGITPVILAL